LRMGPHTLIINHETPTSSGMIIRFNGCRVTLLLPRARAARVIAAWPSGCGTDRRRRGVIWYDSTGRLSIVGAEQRTCRPT
jgi:hypothetical protein